MVIRIQELSELSTIYLDGITLCLSVQYEVDYVDDKRIGPIYFNGRVESK